MPLFAGRYELGSVLGQGGMAEVRAALDTRLERPVAIKIMRSQVAHEAMVRSRFESEARLAARLVHPNVVSVFDSGEDAGIPYIVMERLPGTSLHDRLLAGPLTVPETRHLATEMLAAVGAAHEAGILHRDIKPGNVLASGDGHWKVADFGIAKALEVDHGDATATGLVLGTPAYLAPERRFGAPATAASDLYALGVVLYEALTGARPDPFADHDGQVAGVMGVSGSDSSTRVQTAAPAPLADLVPGIDPALATGVERSLAFDPAERYWTAAEMAAAITCMPTSAAPAPSTPVARPAPATVVMPADGPPPVGTGWGAAVPRPGGWRDRLTGHRPGRGPAAVAGAALLVGLVLALALAGRNGSSHGSPPTSAASASTTASTTVPVTTAPVQTVATTPPTVATKPAPGPGHHHKGH